MHPSKIKNMKNITTNNTTTQFTIYCGANIERIKNDIGVLT
jgi:hypothetical protein